MPPPQARLPSGRARDPRGGDESERTRLSFLEIEGVAKSFHPRGGKTVRAISEATLSLAEGETVAVLGENGSGKTTLLRLAAGLLTPDSGAVRRAAGPGEIAWIAPADYGLYGRLTPRDLLAWFAALDEIPAPAGAIEEALGRANLAGVSGRPIRTFSAGERARLVLARAFLLPARLYLLDEPTRSLDPGAREEIRLRLAEMIRGAAALLVTHDFEEARVLAPVWRPMHAGRLGQARAAGPDLADEYRKAMAGA